MSKFSRVFFLLFLLCNLTFGCGGSSFDPIDNLGTDTSGRVPHQSWGSYRLYSYDTSGRQLVVDLGRPTGAQPFLGENPVVIVHGLGAGISGGNFDSLAQNLLSNGASSVFGFEYDSLDPIETNGSYFAQAMDYLTTNESGRTFRFVAHSMGALVVRTRFEDGTVFDIAPNGNLVSLVAGPHLGTEVAEALHDADQSVVDEAVAQLVLNGELEFRNADGAPVDVTGEEPSFAQVEPNSPFLQLLNATGGATHAQFTYATLAGTERGNNYEAFDRIIGVLADDGIVNVDSANADIGQVGTQTVPFDHTDITQAQAAQLVILNQVGLL